MYTTAILQPGVFVAYAIFENYSTYATIEKSKFDFGPLAHLVERTHGMGEVAGSSPAWSTTLVGLSKYC